MGGNKEDTLKKEEVSSPTVQLESLMITLLIGTYLNRDVATADVVGAYLSADMSGHTIMKISRTSTDMMCKVNPKYSDYIVNEKGKPVLYLQLSKKLWYQTFKGCLETIGIKLNPYDPCVVNMMVKGKQCTLCWYVDDTKISHDESSVVDWVIEEIER